MGWPGGISRLDIPTIPPSKFSRGRSSFAGVACSEAMQSEEGSPEDVLGLHGASGGYSVEVAVVDTNLKP